MVAPIIIFRNRFHRERCVIAIEKSSIAKFIDHARFEMIVSQE